MPKKQSKDVLVMSVVALVLLVLSISLMMYAQRAKADEEPTKSQTIIDVPAVVDSNLIRNIPTDTVPLYYCIITIINNKTKLMLHMVVPVSWCELAAEMGYQKL